MKCFLIRFGYGFQYDEGIRFKFVGYDFDTILIRFRIRFEGLGDTILIRF